MYYNPGHTCAHWEGRTALARTCFAIAVPVGDTWACSPSFSPAVASWGFAARARTKLGKAQELSLSPRGAALSRLHPARGRFPEAPGRRESLVAPGRSGRQPVALGHQGDPASEGICPSARQCCANPRRCWDRADLGEAWGRLRENLKIYQPVPSTFCFPIRARSRQSPLGDGKIGSKTSFFFYARLLRTWPVPRVFSLTNPREMI